MTLAFGEQRSEMQLNEYPAEPRIAPHDQKNDPTLNVYLVNVEKRGLNG